MYFKYLSHPISCLTSGVFTADILSEGCDDPNRSRGCGRASIYVNGKDYSLRRRGYNLVVVDHVSGMSALNIFSFLIVISNQIIELPCETSNLIFSGSPDFRFKFVVVVGFQNAYQDISTTTVSHFATALNSLSD